MNILSILLDKIYTWMASSGLKIVIGFIALWIGWKLVNKIIKTMDRVLKRKDFDVTLTMFLNAFINISLKVLLVMIMMDYVGLKTTGLVTLIGSAGLAVGLALQGSLSNFAGGVVILLIRPFNIGDFIDAVGHSGKVEKIGIFYTSLLTIDNKQILIPNGKLANDSIINYTAKDKRRVDLQFSAGYDENVIEVKNIIEQVVLSNDKILKDPEYFIGLSEHADSSVNFILRAWTNTEDYWDVYYDLLEKVKIKFDDEKISIPYPQMDVHIKND
ncbi:mechanosensitive ion channel [Clostridium botulinum]|uniref:mechanosensitive ion channel family protein n=1 Tax=Clostridium botulinum TaxID=1491 RepID=UPI0007734387|nr:mechanosensitive ion channel domain-containing protein [Clostridium botulinum]MCS6110098.1 mechanosensitive ion channel family protein [Clostridium botulinum]NFE11387.1 mechanosensitive ion channel [Clostridium botulinum]NFE94012.1 mechanosensitive ion channel [Clostridium botulinum]NFL37549.1 mechanosensitive ion channel [Clostridium botulinum]NFL40882.1 mechanosensitive ion channel [Clostridium botulinum]